MNYPNSTIEIYNKEDFEGSPKYILIQDGSSMAALKQRVFARKAETVNIFHVEIAHDRTYNPNDNSMQGYGMVTGAILGGLLGALFAAGKPDPVEWDIDVKIWLKDGRCVKATLKDKTAVKILQPYMNTSQWELEKYFDMIEQKRQEHIKQEKQQAVEKAIQALKARVTSGEFDDNKDEDLDELEEFTYSCSNCHRECREDDTFCSGCGKKFADKQDSSSSNVVGVNSLDTNVGETHGFDSEHIELSQEQQAVYMAMESSTRNMFITGKAGTGKSVLLRYFKGNTNKRYVVLAPTGIAAINVGGQTIHSFFAFDFAALDPKTVWINDETAQILQNTDTCIIDEVSMVRADVMESINRKFQLALKNDKPFGGVQIILIGDLFQLPPVVADDDSKMYLTERFGGYYFFFAPVISKANLDMHELKHIHRQEAPEFKAMLNEVRTGIISQRTVDKFNKRCGKPFSSKQTNCITVATTNNIVNSINISKFNALSGNEYVYNATIKGDVSQIHGQLDKELHLKVGAQVMMLRNYRKNGMLVWANGTTGIVASLTHNSVSVEIDGAIHDVERVSWETRKHVYDTKNKSIAAKAIGEFIQYPLCLAWAITIHKSQGQTYDAVSIDFGSGAFVHGQAYVALSRSKTLEGLNLLRPLRVTDIIVDECVNDFMHNRRIPEHVYIPGKPVNNDYMPSKHKPNTVRSIGIDTIWKNIVQCEGQVFHTKTGIEFTYDVTGDSLQPYPVNGSKIFPITKATLDEALPLMPITSTSPLQKYNSPSYIYALMNDNRIYTDSIASGDGKSYKLEPSQPTYSASSTLSMVQEMHDVDVSMSELYWEPEDDTGVDYGYMEDYGDY